MKRVYFATMIGLGLMLAAGPSDVRAACVDPATAEQIRLAIAQSDCRCDTNPSGQAWDNHGRYVSCVARTANDLARDGLLPTNCKGVVRRCAARSVCGKPGFVACLVPRIGACDDPIPGDLVAEGVCTKTGTACDTDADCLRCTIKSSEELCVERGGVATTAASCCDTGF